MTDQRTREIDFFELEVAPEEEKVDQVYGTGVAVTPEENEANQRGEYITGIDRAAKRGDRVDLRAIYVIDNGDLLDMASLEDLSRVHREMTRRITRGIVKIQDYINGFQMQDTHRPVVLSRPSQDIHMGLGTTFQIGIEPITDVNRVNFADWPEISGWIGSTNIGSLLAQCTPGRDPLTGHGRE